MSDLNFDDLVSDTSLDVECPNCSNDFQVAFNQIGTTVACPHCNIEIALQKDDDFDNTVNNIDSSLNDFNETLKGFDNLEF